MYTIHGSFDEVVAFIHGYHTGHGHSETRWFDFLESERRADEYLDHFFLRVRQHCPDDAAAVRELHTLYTEFLQRTTG
ncbi:hypothetical protein DM785_03875 [Deinococcus actinosclerus]|nr:hypothetical protein DM785_03875 [Deinococcus actinosclerus]